MCLNRKGKPCCMLEMSPEMKTTSRTSRQVWGQRWQLQPHCQGWCLKGVPEFRKGTELGSVSWWRWTGTSVTVSQEAAIYIMYLRILQTATGFSEDVFLKLWRGRVLSWDVYPHSNFVESNPGFHRGNDNQLPRFPCSHQRKKELLLAIRSYLQFPVKYTNVKP